MRRTLVVVITIPVYASAVAIGDLLLAPMAAAGAGEGPLNVAGYNIRGVLSDRATNRPAISLGHDVASCVSTYAAGVDVSPPTCDLNLFVGAVSAITTAVVEVYCK